MATSRARKAGNRRRVWAAPAKMRVVREAAHPDCAGPPECLSGLPVARIALYPGSFDPLTNGHVDMLTAAFRLCDRLVVAIGVHPAKAPMLSVDDRLELIGTVAGPLGAAGRRHGDGEHVRQSRRRFRPRGGGDDPDPRAPRRDRPRLRDADGRDERHDGALAADGIPAGEPRARATSPRRLCGRSPRWAATSRPSCRPRCRRG